MKILIVEDNNDINEMVAEYLTKAGYNCDQAYSGTEGKLYISNNQYDLIILDLMLPGMSGEQLITKIREKLEVPIIVLTAKDSIDSKVSVLGSGADDYLCKPFELEELLARVQVQLRKRNKVSESINYKELKLKSDIYDATINDIPLELTKHEYIRVTIKKS